MNANIERDGNLPLVSVIVRTHGQRRHLLRECLQSIAAQEYRKIEIVVVEDGSANSAACVEQFRTTTDLAVQFHSIAKGGRCRAGNKGLESSTGSLLNFLDDDDQFYPNHVGVLAAKLCSRPDLAAAYTLSLEVPMSLQSLDPLVYTVQPGQPFRGGPFSLGRLCCRTFFLSNQSCFAGNFSSGTAALTWNWTAWRTGICGSAISRRATPSSSTK